ncbi:putative MYB DNA-binding domain-containing protein [Rosellinia necatrix]|uniref:Putative MYB DNA-binding domain-containing protein n=1 Tax=Rosellinia necatrix TaxID=77044 RepID=A0A1S8A9D6_ROSNE|nr:putative MYB DNA-binding domain-containing protein [Rosellinia necatrix]
MVVWSYSIVARQRVLDTWVPPERTALNGRRTLNGENLESGNPSGFLARRQL